MASKLNAYQKIFSITESDKRHKQLCILGLKLRIKKTTSNNIDNNKILFITSNGAFTCNPKYIYQELIKRMPNYKIVWAVNANNLAYIKDFPDGIDFVVYDTSEYYKELATSKLIIMNERRLKEVKNKIYKREGQIYIQTFHGSLGIKKTGIDRNDLSKRSIKISQKDSEQVDYLTSNGKYTTDFFKRTFFNNGKIIETGHPRNDIFFRDNKLLREQIYKKYNIPTNKKIVLYAPTFREDEDTNCFNLDYEKLLEALSKKYNSEWVLLLRLHPRMLTIKDEFKKLQKNIIDTTLYSDMQELLAISDIVITDYSSCIYDFMLTYRPAFIYASDVQKYDNNRGFYYPLTSTPFPVAENNDIMIKNIEQFDYEKYKKDVSAFLNEKGCIDDGKASERVVELIKQIMGNI